MTEREQIEQQIREVLASELAAVVLSDKLFGPGGLFGRLADTEEGRKAEIAVIDRGSGIDPKHLENIFNPFFNRVATLIKRQNLVLSPIDIVMFTDGLPDVGGDSITKYKKINVTNLEYLSKSVTVRVLFPRPTVAVSWERKVPRRRVRMWTVDDEVMNTWRKQYHAGQPPERQGKLWKWISDNVDFRVRSVGVL